MDDFEELLASESDEEHNKEVIRNSNIFTNFDNVQNQENIVKKPSKDIFKGLLSDESEESNHISHKKSKKKEERKSNSISFKHKKKIKFF